MRYPRWAGTLVIALLALLPSVRAACDLACVRPTQPASTGAMPAHCPAHDTAPAEAPTAPSGDTCEHNHGDTAVASDRSAPSAKPVLPVAMVPYLALVNRGSFAQHPAAIRDVGRTPSQAPRFLPLRI